MDSKIQNKINQHGGKRKGAGRKPSEPTKLIRVPLSLVDKIKTMITEHKNEKSNNKKI